MINDRIIIHSIYFSGRSCRVNKALMTGINQILSGEKPDIIMCMELIQGRESVHQR